MIAADGWADPQLLPGPTRQPVAVRTVPRAPASRRAGTHRRHRPVPRDEAAAWTERIIIARGLQLGQNEARRRYDRLAQQHPHHATAQAALLQQLCPKWSGDGDRAFAFARECAQAAPVGAPNAVLVVEAHLERWLDFDTDRERTAYVRSTPVAEEIMQAAQRSMLHPDFVDRPGWVWVRSSFALMFSLTDRPWWEVAMIVVSGVAVLVTGAASLLVTYVMAAAGTEPGQEWLWGVVVAAWLLTVILAWPIVLLWRRRGDEAGPHPRWPMIHRAG
ncbi:hypothetical protein ACLQ24_29425 [Micromonospora sp. DT4]|uniref:hypothetical protein n=1 Tax=Micromonospora sp. DT4 TaxID=3393438 RepID=UPI003CF87136